MQAFTTAYPGLIKSTAEGIGPLQQAQLAADEATNPRASQLATDVYAQQAPQLNKIGNDITAQNAAANNELIKGTGKDLVESFTNLDKEANPEYYASRAGSAKSYQDLLDSINLNGLSGGERAEVERSTNRDNINSGNATSGSPITTVKNAMNFGGAVAAKGNRLAQALDVGSRLMPDFKSGADVFKIATGQTSGANSGDARFQPSTTGGGGAAATGVGNNLLQQTSALQQQSASNAFNHESLGERALTDLSGYS